MVARQAGLHLSKLREGRESGNETMRTNLIGLSFAAAVSMLALAPVPASAWCILGFIGDSCGSPPKGGGGGGGVHGVPGPLAGAGLPFIAVGYGVYWLVRRRRKAN
jgi:hypothetical protein